MKLYAFGKIIWKLIYVSCHIMNYTRVSLWYITFTTWYVTYSSYNKSFVITKSDLWYIYISLSSLYHMECDKKD